MMTDCQLFKLQTELTKLMDGLNSLGTVHPHVKQLPDWELIYTSAKDAWVDVNNACYDIIQREQDMEAEAEEEAEDAATEAFMAPFNDLLNSLFKPE